MTRILELGSPIVQISVSSDVSILVVSTERRVVICDNSKKTFREAGNKTRNGHFGATVIGDGDILCARPGNILTLNRPRTWPGPKVGLYIHNSSN